MYKHLMDCFSAETWLVKHGNPYDLRVVIEYYIENKQVCLTLIIIIIALTKFPMVIVSIVL